MLGSVYSLNVGFVYSLCIVWSANYTFCNAREISEMQGLCRVLCIVCIVFFLLLLTYSVTKLRGTLHNDFGSVAV